MTELLSIYVLTGVAASFLSGLLGIGGGLIIVPILLFVFSYFHIIPNTELMHIVIGTSMASSVVNLVFSFRSHYRQNNIEWSVVKLLSPGVVCGSLILGPIVMLYASSSVLKIIFGICCILFGLQMFFFNENNTPKNQTFPSKVKLLSLGLCIGTLATLIGISGGTIIGTLLNYYHMNMRKVIGTTTTIALLLAITGTIGLFVVGRSSNSASLPWVTGYLYWPAIIGIAIPSPFFAPLGAKLAHKLPTSVLRKLFALLLLLVGIKMMW
jgi:uncharacterized membrane protein YfcA